ncbi:hypothetical protein NDU88_003709 [Pleurodeles waltl]|uniref:Uncharacterized protein n=1 Tax=Pleurodeles waltl TaxID=8319 RepID=A0AAV7PCV0_PLEWA|nr:hypothetical protein NDU88_003709 [Pleurodeles waltl]
MGPRADATEPDLLNPRRLRREGPSPLGAPGGAAAVCGSAREGWGRGRKALLLAHLKTARTHIIAAGDHEELPEHVDEEVRSEIEFLNRFKTKGDSAPTLIKVRLLERSGESQETEATGARALEGAA